jgi:tRNA pseudouridine55 synthase
MSLFPYEPSGLFLVDKGSGPTSHDCVAWARRVLDTPNVGHCGTLDPSATGLLLLVSGETLKFQNQFTTESKVYRGTFRFGIRTDTDDLAGKRIGDMESKFNPVTVPEEMVKAAFEKYSGTFEQKVPLYSAVKVRGRKLYEWARKGIPVELPVKTVTVRRFDLVHYDPSGDVEFLVDCTKGTYVRSLARDIGETLGTGGLLASLRRESIGPFHVNGAYVWRGETDFRKEDVLKSFIPHHKLLDTILREDGKS